MRARSLKPGFFKNEHLAQLPYEIRLLFAGLWGLADSTGRLEDRSLRIHAEIFPFEPNLDVNSMLDALETSEGKFIRRYAVNGHKYIQVNNFHKHQNPHHREPPSIIPAEPRAKPQAEPRAEPTISAAQPGGLRTPDSGLPFPSSSSTPGRARGSTGEDERGEYGENPGDTGTWTRVLEVIRPQLDPKEFKTWFSQTREIDFVDNALRVQVPTLDAATWIQHAYVSRLDHALAGLGINAAIHWIDRSQRKRV